MKGRKAKRAPRPRRGKKTSKVYFVGGYRA